MILASSDLLGLLLALNSLIAFDFDEYVSYINMFIDNNIDRLSMYDSDIVDYLRIFPSIIGDCFRPHIRLYTNYREV